MAAILRRGGSVGLYGIHSSLVRIACVCMLLASTALRAEEGVLVVGRISDDPQQHYEQIKPLLDYVVGKLADVGIKEGRVLMARDRAQMRAYLKHGRVDWVTETAGTALVLTEEADAKVLLVTQRNGVSNYRSVIFVRDSSPITQIEELRGRSIAFQSSASTSAYLLPALTIREENLELEILPTPFDRPGQDRVGYVFAGTESNIAAWVERGLVDAGAFSNIDWEIEVVGREPYQSRLRILTETQEVPRAVELISEKLDQRVAERLRQVLLEAKDDPSASEALRRFFGTTAFLDAEDDVRRQLKGLQLESKQLREAIE